MITIKIALYSGKDLMKIFMLIREVDIINKEVGMIMIEDNIMKEDNLSQIMKEDNLSHIMKDTNVTLMTIMIKLKEFIQTLYFHNHTQKFNARPKIVKNLTI